MYGFAAKIMVPNIIYALKCKKGFENKWNYEQVCVVDCSLYIVRTCTYFDFI